MIKENQVFFMLRFAPSVRQKIKAKAAEAGMTMHNFIMKILCETIS